MLELSEKLAALERIYEIYDRFAGGFEFACEERCASCCTCNVTATTLEGFRIVDRLLGTKEFERLHDIESCPPVRRYQPRAGINEMAELCAEGKELPEEETDPSWGRCFFLKNELCSIYPLRPFGCRCMVSRSRCQDEAADMDPFVFSVNTLILQTIEHVDRGGCSGNLIDILQFLSTKEGREAYGEGRAVCGTPLIANRSMTKLFVPPEHRKRMEPILRAIWAIGVREKFRS